VHAVLRDLAPRGSGNRLAQALAMTPTRIAVACPSPAERAALSQWLREGGFEPVAVDTYSPAEAAESARCEAILADATVVGSGGPRALARARTQLRPLIVIGPRDASAAAAAERYDASYVERPVGRDDLLLMVALALGEGRPARRSPRRSVPRLPASVNGAVAWLLDVSGEGLRLEVGAEHRATLPPYFTVKVPEFEVGLVVQRVWVGSASKNGAQCGATLVANPPVALEHWRSLVETASTMAATGIARA
jgi:CheY-like chemotaxis protein